MKLTGKQQATNLAQSICQGQAPSFRMGYLRCPLPCPEACLPDRDDTCICRPHRISSPPLPDITPSSSTCNTASCSGAEGTSLRNITEREVPAATGTRHVADVQSEMGFRCSALDCDDRLTHSQGGGANAPRSQAEFPHVNRMVSLTNAPVIQSLLFVVVLDFRS